MNKRAIHSVSPPQRHLSRRGFTLVEMTLAAAITTLVMAGLFSATLIAARVAESPYKSSALNLHAVLDRMRDDASVATAVPVLTANTMTLTLADRNGDGQPDTVTYDWSRATNAAGIITRTYNGVAESIAVVAPSFAVTTDLSQTTSTASVESSEQLLFSRAPTLPIAYAIKTAQWTGQYVVPSLPSNTTSWKVTRVRIPARFKGATGGQTRVQIRNQSGGVPLTVVDEAMMLESSLTSSFVTNEFSFTKATNLPLGGICLVLQWDKDADACEVQYESLLSILAAGNRVISTTSGASWTAQSLQCLACEIYGTYTTPGTSSTVKKLRALNFTVKSDAALAGTVTTTIRFINLPTVAP